MDSLDALRLAAVSGPSPGLQAHQHEFLKSLLAANSMEQFWEMLTCKTLKHIFRDLSGFPAEPVDLKVAKWDWDIDEVLFAEWAKKRAFGLPLDIMKSFVQVLLDKPIAGG